MSLRACQVRILRTHSLRCLQNRDHIPVLFGGSCLCGMVQHYAGRLNLLVKSKGHALLKPFKIIFLSSFTRVSICFYLSNFRPEFWLLRSHRPRARTTSSFGGSAIKYLRTLFCPVRLFFVVLLLFNQKNQLAPLRSSFDTQQQNFLRRISNL